MKKILVPVDFSELSIHALNLAVQLAYMGRAQVVALHVIELGGASLMSPDMSGVSYTWLDTYMRDMKQTAENNMSKLLANYPSVNIKSHIETGHPYSHISTLIQAEEADLVVMGTHGIKGLAETLVGSNTEKVVRNSSCPVIAIKQSTDAAKLKNIVVGIHYKEVPDELLMRLKQLQDLLKATLHLVWVNTPTHFESDAITKDSMQQLAVHHLLKDFTLNVYNDYFEDEGLRNFAASIHADMIAVGTHGRKGLSAFFQGSVASDLVNLAPRPVWSFKI